MPIICNVLPSVTVHSSSLKAEQNNDTNNLRNAFGNQHDQKSLSFYSIRLLYIQAFPTSEFWAQCAYIGRE